MKKKWMNAALIGWIAVACQVPGEKQVLQEIVPGLDLNNMDTTASPKADFYRFANGGWLDRTVIPEKEGSWGGFGELREKNNQRVYAIMEQAADNPQFADGSDERKAVDFFAVGMDSVLAERAGIQPIRKWYDKIDQAEDRDAIADVIENLHRTGYGPFHSVNAFADLMDSKTNALYLTAGGLGLPNRDYYTKTDQKSVEIREKYRAHISRMLTLTGEDQTEDRARAIFELENRLALASLTPIEARNIPALYNPMTVDEVQKLAPALDWNRYLDQIGVDLSRVDTLIVTQPRFIAAVSEILSGEDLHTIKDYLKWNVVNQASGYLNHELVKANFDFYSGVIRGTKEMRPRWERVLGATNRVIGEAIGKVYVAETFPPEAKQSAEEMVADLIQAFDGRIRQLEWMTGPTQEQALRKLHNLTVKIGYPNKWRDYATLQVDKAGEGYSYLGNMENAWKWQFAENIREVGEPVDKERWGMNPQTVNAYFNPLNNEIVFPAAILQPPFYNYTADAAVNYGGMGAVIGHEISHGFDDQGSRFDSEGNMVNWWTDTDREQFEVRTARLVAQYDAYEPLDSLHVQGKLTLGENIGDLGGLNAAYDALQIYLDREGNPGLIDGYTPEQRFFISWATIWRTKYRDETLRTQILTNPHSPAMYRATGPLENMETFYQAFDIREGDAFYKAPGDRVIIW